MIRAKLNYTKWSSSQLEPFAGAPNQALFSLHWLFFHERCSFRNVRMHISSKSCWTQLLNHAYQLEGALSHSELRKPDKESSPCWWHNAWRNTWVVPLKAKREPSPWFVGGPTSGGQRHTCASMYILAKCTRNLQIRIEINTELLSARRLNTWFYKRRADC